MHPSLQRLHDLVAFAEYNYRIWRFYTTRPGASRFIPVMQPYSEFFGASRQAHLSEAIICTYQIFDARWDSLNFRTVLDELVTAGIISARWRQQFDRRLVLAQPTHGKVKTLRHKWSAHRDRHQDEDAVFRAAAISPKMLYGQIERAKRLVNNLASQTARVTFAFNIRPADDLRSVVDVLEREFKRWQSGELPPVLYSRRAALARVNRKRRYSVRQRVRAPRPKPEP